MVTTGNELSPRGTGATTRPSYRTPKAPCLCWVSAPTNDNWPSDKSAGPANSSPPACPCTSHLSSTLPAPDLAQYTASSEMHVHLASSRFSDSLTNQRSPGAQPLLLWQPDPRGPSEPTLARPADAHAGSVGMKPKGASALTAHCSMHGDTRSADSPPCSLHGGRGHGVKTQTDAA